MSSIKSHEGSKYLRTVKDLFDRRKSVQVDVYEVLEAFGVHDAATTQAAKKLLCAGLRGKGDRLADLKGAAAAVSRAIEIEEEKVALANAEACGMKVQEPVTEFKMVVDGQPTTMSSEAVIRLMDRWMTQAKLTASQLDLASLPKDCPLIEYGFRNEDAEIVVRMLLLREKPQSLDDAVLAEARKRIQEFADEAARIPRPKGLRACGRKDLDQQQLEVMKSISNQLPSKATLHKEDWREIDEASTKAEVEALAKVGKTLEDVEKAANENAPEGGK